MKCPKCDVEMEIWNFDDYRVYMCPSDSTMVHFLTKETFSDEQRKEFWHRFCGKEIKASS